MVRLALLLALVSAPAWADVCKYVDAESNFHYSNVPAEKGWTLVSCEQDAAAADAMDAKAWRLVRAKVKIGMTEDQLRAVDPVLLYADRRTIKSVGGIDEWLKFNGFSVRMHNHRVVAISW